MGVVVLTDQRVVLIRQDMGKEQSEAFRYEDVRHVSWGTGRLAGLRIAGVAGEAKIDRLPAQEGPIFQRMIQERMPSATGPAAESDAAVDVISQIERLGALRTAGVLSGEEFAAKKAELLGRL